jgi:tRNA-modifying protein YgfZ
MAISDTYRALREGAGVLDRGDRGRLVLSGGDRRAYLQGILTNDIAALGPGTGCYAAYLTPQGRMIADLRVFEMGDRILVDLDASLAAAVADRWSMFVITEDVTVENVSEATAQVGVYGPSAAAVLRQALEAGHAPDESVPEAAVLAAMPLHGSARWDFGGEPAFVLASDDIGVRGYDVVLAAGREGALVAELAAAGAVTVGPADAETTRIEAGRPKFLVDMTTDTIPLEAGIEDRAISLTKGCYVGQEIIIRVLHRGGGRVAKRLVGLSFEAGQPPPVAGAPVTAGGREMGSVTSATASPMLGHAIALGYVHRDFVEPGTVVEVGGTPARVAGLPFVP